MTVISHQTVRLSRGRHSSPTDGACVMELASMLAGERFSDRPSCACPFIGAFLRAYNDRSSRIALRNLRPWASAVVGSRGDRAVLEARVEAACRRAEAWRRRRTPVWRLVHRPLAPVPCDDSLGLERLAGVLVARLPRGAAREPAAFGLLDELLRIDAGREASAPTPRRLAAGEGATPALSR